MSLLLTVKCPCYQCHCLHSILLCLNLRGAVVTCRLPVQVFYKTGCQIVLFTYFLLLCFTELTTYMCVMTCVSCVCHVCHVCVMT